MSDMSSMTSIQPHALSLNMSRSSGFVSFNNQNPKSMSIEELEEEFQKLKDVNHQLQLRILGVNELARLLQDRSEKVQIYEEKNKRLEVAVVRLEHRCANIEKMTKKNGGITTQGKSGQSPFIPGPSRQILEGLMKENSELKKTVNNLTKKGASGYLEAVKLTQLEELIDCQKEELKFLREQIKSLTDSGTADTKEIGGGGLSLPGHVSDSGPLKRQLIKAHHAMKVKDRFSALLSQQIAELQSQLLIAQRQSSDDSKSLASLVSQGPLSEVSTPAKKANDSELEEKYRKIVQEQKDEIEKLRDDHATSVEKMSSLENILKQNSKQIDDLEKERDRLTNYHQTLLVEKEELAQTLQLAQNDLEELFAKRGSGGGQTDEADSSDDLRILQLERENRDLQKAFDDEMTQHREQRQSYESDLMNLRSQVEEADLKAGMAESKLQHQVNVHGQELAEMTRSLNLQQEKVDEMGDDIGALHSENSELKTKLSETKIELSQAKSTRSSSGGNTSVPSSFSLIGGGAHHGLVDYDVNPSGLIYPDNTNAMVMVRDGKSKEENRPQGGHCEKPFYQTEYNRSQILARGVTPTENKPNLDLSLNQHSPPYPQGYLKQNRSTSPLNQQGRVPSTTSFPSPHVQQRTSQLHGPLPNFPPSVQRGRSSQSFQQPHSSNQPQMSGMASTPGYSSRLYPQQQPPSPTPFQTSSSGRPLNYSGNNMTPLGGGAYSQPHLLSTSVYPAGSNLHSNPGHHHSQQPQVGYSPVGRPNLIYRPPDDDVSKPGGQRSNSPNPTYYSGSSGQHR